MKNLSTMQMGRLILVALLTLGAAACGNSIGPQSALTGGTCTGDRDCFRRCVTGDSHYPGGYCTLNCASDADCPGGTTCIDENGGMCVVNCLLPADCAAFGRGFTCDGRRRRGAPGGDALVCRVP